MVNVVHICKKCTIFTIFGKCVYYLYVYNVNLSCNYNNHIKVIYKYTFFLTIYLSAMVATTTDLDIKPDAIHPHHT